MACCHVLISLNSCSSSTDPVDNRWKPNVDVSTIHKGAQTVEDAFASNDTNKLLDCMSPNARQRYAGMLYQALPRMAAFASAIKQRNLDNYSERYAEYSFVYASKTYSFAMGRQDDNTWKLVRF